jgi:hypothetical protein
MANIPTLTDEQREALLARQYTQALAGSEALLIHLGKSYLNQHDKAHLVIEALPFSDKTVEELHELLAQRAQEVAELQAVSDLNQQLLLPSTLPGG